MVHYHNLIQGSPEWFEFRKGMLTGSNATAIGANGTGLITYCKKIAMELSGFESEKYTNSDMARGNELESIGRYAYELEYSTNVIITGCVTNDDYPDVLISPDGLIGDNGGIEIKARNDEKHYSLILGETKEIPDNQIQMTLLITDRKWWDFVSINPNFTKPIFVKRVYPDLLYHRKLIAGFSTGRKLIKEFKDTYENYNN